MYDFHDFGLTFFLHNVFFVLLTMSKNVLWVVARLSQRLFWNFIFIPLAPSGSLHSKFLKNVDFSLWGNRATTQMAFFDIFKSTKNTLWRKKVLFQLCLQVVTLLPAQRLKSMFFEIFLTPLAPLGPLHSNFFQKMLILAFEANSALLSCQNGFFSEF